MSKPRGNRRRVEGIVTSDKMEKSITVRVERLVKVPKYGKYVRRHTTCHAHDENNDAKVGDRVELLACRRLSKTKAWRLASVVRRSGDEQSPADEAEPKVVEETVRTQ